MFPANQPFSYSLRAVLAGDQTLFDSTAAAPVGPVITDDNQVRYDRADGVVETYEPLASGLEQRFVIDAPLPLGGDLRIEGSVDTSLTPTQVEGRGIVFSTGDDPADEVLTYGQPMLIDAAGRVIAGQLALEEGAIVLRFTWDQLQDLQLPLTVDPLIGSNFAIDTHSADSKPAVAWNSTRNEYFVVYYNSGLGLIASQRVSATGSLIGSSTPMQFGQAHPSVAYSPATNKYLVAMENSGQTTIWVDALNYDGSQSNPGFTSFTGNRDPQVTYQANDNFLLTYSSTGSGTPPLQQIVGVRLNSSLTTLTTSTLQSTNNSTAYTRPRSAYNSTNDNFYVAWEDPDGSARSAAFSGTLATLGPTPNIQLSAHGREPAVAWNSTRNEYLVVWDDNAIFGVDYDLFMQRIVSSGTSIGQQVGGIRVVDASTKDQKTPEIRYNSLGDEYLVSYTNATGTNNHDIYSQPIRTDGVDRGGRVAINTGTYDTLNPSLGINSSTGTFLVVWEDHRASGKTQIYGQLQTDTSPRVFSSDPPANATSIPTDYSVTVVFTDAMLSSSVNSNNLTLTDLTTFQLVSISVTYNSSSRSALMTPSAQLVASRSYQIRVNDNVLDTSNNHLVSQFLATFTTGAGPGLADSDHDGLLDVEEAILGTSPTNADTDGDGLSDFAELFIYGTDPLRPDTDMDGTTDGQEITNGTNPLDPTSGGAAGYNPTPLVVVDVAPPNNAQNVAVTTAVWVTFNEPISTTTVNYGTNFKVENITAQPPTLVSGTLAYHSANRGMIFYPSANLSQTTNYRITVQGGTGAIADPSTPPQVLAATTVTTFTTQGTGGGPAGPIESPFHPSFAQSTAAGAIAQAFGSGNIPAAPGRGSPGTDAGGGVDVPSVPGFGGGCSACEECDRVNVFPDPGDGSLKVFWSDYERTAVLLSDGSFVHAHVDWAYRDRSLYPVVFGRTYRSNLSSGGQPFVGLFGNRTVCNWETRLIGYSGTGSSFVLLTPDGRQYTATPSGGTWTVPSLFARFYLDTSRGLVKLIFYNGMTFAYLTSTGQLSYLRDRNGNTQTCGYTGSQLTSITDATGRQTAITYTGGGAIYQITNYDGLVLTYGYDGNGNLTSVTLPPSDDAPSGRQSTYAYTGSSLMTTLTNARNQTYLTNSYDPTLNVVLSQDHINGTHYYLYNFQASPGTFTTTIDRMGNVTDVQHDATGAPITITQHANGANPLDPTTSWVTSYSHDAAGHVTQVVLPRQNVQEWVYDGNGFLSQHRLKTSTAPDNDANDLVENFEFDPMFGVLLRYMEPRANLPNMDGNTRMNYTHFFFHDHEDIPTRLAAEQTYFGVALTIVGNALLSYGRTGSGQFPAKDSTTFVDADGDGLIDHGGNLWFVHGAQPQVINSATGGFQSSRQAIESFSSYNQLGQPILKLDPNGNSTRWQYYSGTFNQSTYPAAGYLLCRVVDTNLSASQLNLTTGDPTTGDTGTHLALTTTFTYDARGNLLTEQSPRGLGRVDQIFLTQYTVNANNLVRSKTVSAPFSYQWTYSYDGNMKLIEEDIPNVVANDLNGNGIQDGSGEQTTGTPFKTTYTYCVCNDVITRTVDASGLALTTTYGYDLSQRRTMVRDPFGNAITTAYDERDLPIVFVAGAEDTDVAATTKRVYDANGNFAKVYDPASNITTYTFDGFDRQQAVVDPLSNETDSIYDVASHLTQVIRKGNKNGQSQTIEILAQSYRFYDEAGRVFETQLDHFDVQGNVALSHGSLTPPDMGSGARGNLVSAVTSFDAGGRAVARLDDNMHLTSYSFDAANRVTVAQDPRGNKVIQNYDRDGHPTDVQEAELGDDGSNVKFLTRTFSDELGRPIVSMSPLGNTVRRLYDSRGNVLQTADAQANNLGNASGLDTYGEHQFNSQYPDVAVSGAGNRVRFTFDGANRLTEIDRDLTTDGSGNGSVAHTIRNTRTYDKASRLITQADDNGNTTTYNYDALNRPIRVLNADGTQKIMLYDRRGPLLSVRDERNVVSQYTLDLLGRRTGTTVSNVPPGYGQTTFETLQYDGLSRLTQGENNHALLKVRYDSLGPVIQEDETVNTAAADRTSGGSFASSIEKVVNASYDGVGNQTQLSYPVDTEIVINQTYDANDRRVLVKDGSTAIANYLYIGPGGRVLQKQLPQANTTLFRTYDGDRRVIQHDQTLVSNGNRTAGFSYAWDRVGNRWFEEALTGSLNGGTGVAYVYDSAYRLTQDFEGTPASSLNGITNNTPRATAVTGYTKARQYDLDGVGNRQETIANGVVDHVFAMLNPNDFLMNQYSYYDDAPQSYDKAGNLLNDGTWGYFYSARNQLVEAINGSTDVRYRHDVLGRRVSKRMASGNFPGWGAYAHTVYVNFGARILNEYDGATGAFRKEWVYGNGIDEPIRMRAPDYEDIFGNPSAIIPLYYLTNSLGTIVALVDSNGTAREQYVYDVWGGITNVYDKYGSPTGASWTKVGNPWNFTGRQFEFEEQTGLYHYRARAYESSRGQFLQRDPWGAWVSNSLGSSRNYAVGNPANGIDPAGLDSTLWVEGTPTTTGDDEVFGIPFPDDSIVSVRQIGCCNKHDRQFVESVWKGPIWQVDYWTYCDGHVKYQIEIWRHTDWFLEWHDSVYFALDLALIVGGVEVLAGAAEVAAAGPLVEDGSAAGGAGAGGTVVRRGKAPRQVTPGVRHLTGEYDPPTRSAPEPYSAHYDEYGRLIERTDYTDQPDPDTHTNPHHHITTYGPGTGAGEETGPLPGPAPQDRH
jgi:RHS repeat-associated protein